LPASVKQWHGLAPPGSSNEPLAFIEDVSATTTGWSVGNGPRLLQPGAGYDGDEDSKKMRGYFAQGNAYTLKKMQEHFAKKAAK
jgi:hypothetical protein